MRYFKLALLCLLTLALQNVSAASLGKFVKSNALRGESGDLHTTFFVVKSTNPVSTHITVSVGHLVAGVCKPEVSRSDDFDIPNNSALIICGNCIMQEAGGGYTCAIENYKNNNTGKTSTVNFKLLWDGKNYTGAIPDQDTVVLD